MYANSQDGNYDWEKSVPENVSKIIIENWQIIEKFASAEDMTKRIAGMKFPKDGYDSK